VSQLSVIGDTTAEVEALHARLTAYLHAHFRHNLTREEASDAAAEALAEAEQAARRGHEIRDVDRWVKRAGWRNALSEVRRQQGEAAVPRQRPQTLDPLADAISDGRDETQAALDADAHRTDADVLAAALATLPPVHRRVLRMRYFDERPVPEILDELGCTRHQYENTTKRALRMLRRHLGRTTGDRACAEYRMLAARSANRPLPPAVLVRRDVHRESCLSCRAYTRTEDGLM
jgi:RNA polymerase sigma factor (sigma-70 family)